MKIVIITDGNNTLGMGHIYQSRTLAGFLSSKTGGSADILFMTKSNATVAELLSATGKPVLTFADDDAILDALIEQNPDRIVFDKLDVSPALARKIKEQLGSKLIIFTNLTEANDFADVAVLADIGSNFENIINYDEATGTTRYFGPRYWLLRPEFYVLKEKRKTHDATVSNIMLIFGGSDPCNISSQVLNELMKMDTAFNILLVLGAAFAHHDELQVVLDNNLSSASKVSIVKNMTNVGETMHNSDLVLASPGLSFFEALAVGTPVIGFHQDQLQMEVYAEILPTLGIDDIPRLPDIIKNKSFIYPEDEIIKRMEIGEGKDALIDEILN